MNARPSELHSHALVPAISVAILLVGCGVERTASELANGASVASPDGEDCVLTDTIDGATIACAADTVTITRDGNGSSCNATTDSVGNVLISCDDGTSARVPARGGGSDVSAQLLCHLIGENDLKAPAGLDCPLYCPCFTEVEILASDVTGCRSARASMGSLSGELVDTLPLAESARDGYFVSEIGAFSTTLGTGIAAADQTPVVEPTCVGPGAPERVLTAGQHLNCKKLIEDTVGPCEATSRANALTPPP